MSNIFEKFDMKNKAVIVTGGAGLLGQQFSKTLAEAGAGVVVADLLIEKAEDIAIDLRKSGYQAIAVQVDITDKNSVENLVAKTIKEYGILSGLINSAAMDPKFDNEHTGQHNNSFEDYPVEMFRSALDVNLTGMFLCCQAAVKEMLKHNKGSIVNICSTYGLVGPDQRLYEREGQPRQYKPVFYTVSKAGVLGLTKYLATYYMGTQIRVNALTPGGVYNQHDETFTERYSARTVLGRMADQDEMNGACLFLASDASSYMTGSNLVVDGGWTAW
ncbi:MAG: SDR family oxidoreductase [Anaerolineaceae bacterium]|nr:SDR family oxidoreductase [Anaerolineaceae bacterium]